MKNIAHELFGDVVKSAEISACDLYRYGLTRVWHPERASITWCMLNPSTADAKTDDPTIRKCIGFARRWGYGGIRVINLFALRATDPKELLRVRDPVGPANIDVLRGPLDAPVIVGWGSRIPQKPFADRMARIVRMRARVEADMWYCLGRTKYGEPRHPLMLPYTTAREPWR